MRGCPLCYVRHILNLTTRTDCWRIGNDNVLDFIFDMYIILYCKYRVSLNWHSKTEYGNPKMENCIQKTESGKQNTENRMQKTKNIYYFSLWRSLTSLYPAHCELKTENKKLKTEHQKLKLKIENRKLKTENWIRKNLYGKQKTETLINSVSSGASQVYNQDTASLADFSSKKSFVVWIKKAFI